LALELLKALICLGPLQWRNWAILLSFLTA
jgi:hypothetical protein